ncbi:Nicastrin-domain-containing protein [Zopfochytrium polystomum]|nr:Nicastrin-domain-containing protein [Zopfochytrium polystomum]
MQQNWQHGGPKVRAILAGLLLTVVFATTISPPSALAATNTYLQSSLYQSFDLAEGSVRLLQQNASYGASGKNELTSGIMYLVATSDDLSAFLAFNPTLVKFAVVLSYNMFSPSVLDELSASGKVVGVIVLERHPVFPNVSAYSPDSTFPNFEFSLYANLSNPPHEWNPQGNGLLNRNYDFPMFLLGKQMGDLTWPRSIGGIVEAVTYNKNRSYVNYPLYGVEFDDFMWAAFDVVTCLRRGVCKVVGGNSVWSPSVTNMSATDGRKIIFVTAGLDARSFFLDSSWGVATATSNYVALIAVAQALSVGPIPMANLSKTIVFTAFSAEQFGFAGSKRFVQDLTTPFKCFQQSADPTGGCPFQNFACSNPCVPFLDFTNINFDNIDSILEFNQVSGIGLQNPDQATIFMHVDDMADVAATNLAQNFVGSIQTAFPQSQVLRNVSIAPAWADGLNRRLPPSSSMAFLAKKRIPAVVFGDYKDSYTNRFYNSELEDNTTWNRSHAAVICGLATQVARGLFVLAGGSKTAATSVTTNCSLVEELMFCFTQNMTCELFRQFYNNSVPLYVSQSAGPFSRDNSLTYVPFYVEVLLYNYTAANRTVQCAVVNEDPCPKISGDGFACLAGRCVKSSVSVHPAYGLGIEYDPSTGSPYVKDSSQPTYVMSMYANPGRRMRVFLTTSIQYEAMELGLGVGLTALTVGLYFGVINILSRHLKLD